MTLDTKRTVIKVQLRRFLTLVVFIGFALGVMLLGDLQKEVLGLNKYHRALVILFLYFVSLLIEAWFELNYIYFNDDNDIIMLRYFSMSVFSKKKNSIEIPKKVFKGYQLKKVLFGLKKKIILKQFIKDTVVKYPPVSITGLKPNEFRLLLKTLDSYK